MSVQTAAVLEGFISEDEFAAMTRRSTRTLYRWDKDGIGPPRVRIGGLILYRTEAVQQWLRENERLARRNIAGRGPVQFR